MRHRPKIVRNREATSDGEAWVYRLTCTCGETGHGHYAKRDALADRNRHVTGMAAPPELRCHRPDDHGCRAWDACDVCSHQAALPGLDPQTLTS